MFKSLLCSTIVCASFLPARADVSYADAAMFYGMAQAANFYGHCSFKINLDELRLGMPDGLDLNSDLAKAEIAKETAKVKAGAKVDPTFCDHIHSVFQRWISRLIC